MRPTPACVGPATLALDLSQDGSPLRGATVRVEGDMSHAGMVPVFALAGETAPGHYEAGLQFSMAGDWILLVDATLPDGRALHRRLELPAVRPAPGRPEH